jgi:hypothetical protein
MQQTSVVTPGGSIQARFDADIGDDDRLQARYESRDDSFEVFDTSLHPGTPGALELSTADATKMFAATFNSLSAAGLIDPSRLRPADVVTRQVHASEGDQSGLRRTWIDEHAFFVPLTISGVHVGTMEGFGDGIAGIQSRQDREPLLLSQRPGRNGGIWIHVPRRVEAGREPRSRSAGRALATPSPRRCSRLTVHEHPQQCRDDASQVRPYRPPAR